MTQRHRFIEPRDLLTKFANHERLEEVSELGQRRWIQGRKFRFAAAQQPGSESRIDDVQFGQLRCFRATRLSPRRQELDEKEILEKSHVSIKRLAVSFKTGERGCCAEHLRALNGEALEQDTKQIAPPDPCELDSIALDTETDVVVEPPRPGGTCAAKREGKPPAQTRLT